MHSLTLCTTAAAFLSVHGGYGFPHMLLKKLTSTIPLPTNPMMHML
jgi:hypothetical protein